MSRDRLGVAHVYEPSTSVPGFARPAVWHPGAPTGAVVPYGQPPDPIAEPGPGRGPSVNVPTAGPVTSSPQSGLPHPKPTIQHADPIVANGPVSVGDVECPDYGTVPYSKGERPSINRKGAQ